MAAIKRRGGFDVTVSAYPECHPHSSSFDHDVDTLIEKVAAGADRAKHFAVGRVQPDQTADCAARKHITAERAEQLVGSGRAHRT